MDNKETTGSVQEYHLRVYSDRSELYLPDGSCTAFLEGGNTITTQARYKNITTTLAQGFLKTQIALCKGQTSAVPDTALLVEKYQLTPCATFSWLQQ